MPKVWSSDDAGARRVVVVWQLWLVFRGRSGSGRVRSGI